MNDLIGSNKYKAPALFQGHGHCSSYIRYGAEPAECHIHSSADQSPPAESSTEQTKI